MWRRDAGFAILQSPAKQSPSRRIQCFEFTGLFGIPKLKILKHIRDNSGFIQGDKVMKRHILAAALCLASAAGAQAATITFGPTAGSGFGPNIAFNNLTALPSVNSDATFTFSVRGDLDWRHEYVDVSIDGYSLGRVFDNNPNNDAFDFARDRGTQFRQLHTGTAVIEQSVFAGLVADGELDVLFDFSFFVNLFRVGSVSHLSGTITYDSAVDNSPTPAVVPLPASAALLAGGLFGLGALRRRKKAQNI